MFLYFRKNEDISGKIFVFVKIMICPEIFSVPPPPTKSGKNVKFEKIR